MAGIEYQRFRAPAGHGEALCWPSAADAWRNVVEHPPVVDRSVRLWDISLAELSRQARDHLWSEALQYSSQYCDIKPPTSAGPFVLTGHQAELFHPGVWFKNFLLNQFARRGAWTVNVVIDNDLARSAAVMVPQSDGNVVRVPLDRPLLAPYEDRPILDAELFASFPRRAKQVLDGWRSATMLDQLWPEALRAHGQQGQANLGYCLSRARHVIEQQWGLQNYEVPLSRLCDGAPFRRFAAYLLGNAARFGQAYNECLDEYRRVHRVRSPYQPAPNLELPARPSSLGELDSRRPPEAWIETPFWVWSASDPQRRALLVRESGKQLFLSDGAGLDHAVTQTDIDGAQSLLGLLQSAKGSWKLRPRALITTMYLRLLCSDCFLHGIGGAKYDQVTDHLCQQFWGVRPPPYVVATATITLTGRDPQANRDEVRSAARSIRDLRFNPQRFLNGQGPWTELVAQRQQWVEQSPPLGQGWPRRCAIESFNQQLGVFVQPQADAAAQRHDRAVREMRSEQRRNSREYSLCLFSAEQLPPLLLALSAWEA